MGAIFRPRRHEDVRFAFFESVVVSDEGAADGDKDAVIADLLCRDVGFSESRVDMRTARIRLKLGAIDENGLEVAVCLIDLDYKRRLGITIDGESFPLVLESEFRVRQRGEE